MNEPTFTMSDAIDYLELCQTEREVNELWELLNKEIKRYSLAEIVAPIEMCYAKSKLLNTLANINQNLKYTEAEISIATFCDLSGLSSLLFSEKSKFT